MVRVLDELEEIIKQDVEKAHEALGRSENSQITIEREKNCIRVIRPVTLRIWSRPCLPCMDRLIRSRSRAGELFHAEPSMFFVTPKWDWVTYSCRRMVEGGGDYEPWEVVQQALGWLVFEDWPTVVVARPG